MNLFLKFQHSPSPVSRPHPCPLHLTTLSNTLTTTHSPRDPPPPAPLHAPGPPLHDLDRLGHLRRRRIRLPLLVVVPDAFFVCRCLAVISIGVGGDLDLDLDLVVADGVSFR